MSRRLSTDEGTITATEVLYYAYDASGLPMSVTLTDATDAESTYYYAVNIQSDVVAILNTSGTAVVEYTYDAWGNPLAVTGTLADTLGKANSLRYRGYVYDNETGFYYLSSRYYNPEIGRFINADNRIANVGSDVFGYNMFAYCINNPVNMSDSTGNWPKWLENTVKVVSAVVLVVAVATTVAAVSAVTAGTGSVAAVYSATIFLGAALSGINAAVANEAKGNSYINGYLGGATGGAIQASLSKTPVGVVAGGGVGVAVGTTVTDVLNNLDPDSSNSSAQQIINNALTSGGKALITSSLTAYMSYAADMAVAEGTYGYTFGFGEAIKAFFGWLDDAIVCIWGE